MQDHTTGGRQTPTLTIPIDIVWQDRNPLILIGEICADEIDSSPFWDLAIAKGARRTALLPLDSMPLYEGSVGLAGAIHHMTRCGSTALLRQFHALDRVVGLSEPFIFFKLLTKASADPSLAQVRLRRLVGMFSDGLAPISDRLVIKWPTLLCRSAAVLAEALPEVPMVFIYRRPEEVLASIQSNPLGNVRDLSELLLEGPSGKIAQNEVTQGIGAVAHLLAANCRWIAQVETVQRLDYAELPEAGWRNVAPYFGFDLSPAQVAAMQAEAMRDAKKPDNTFVPDSLCKRRTASVEVRQLATDVVKPALAEVTARLSPVGTIPEIASSST
jgi:hypothetical protein